MRNLLRRILTPPLVFIAAAALILEETLIAWLQALMARLAKLPVVAAAEAWAARLPPYPAMGLFLLPAVVLLPVKLSALWLIAHGSIGAGIAIILAGKVVGTAIAARIYKILHPSLSRLAWFVAAERWVFGWRDRLYGYVKATATWHAIVRVVHAAKASVRSVLARRPGWLGRRFAAARRQARRER